MLKMGWVWDKFLSQLPSPIIFLRLLSQIHAQNYCMKGVDESVGESGYFSPCQGLG
jgi:hypothetical protein